MQPQVIVCGLGRTGYRIFSILRQQGIAVVGISDRPLPGELENIVIGDSRDETTLLSAGIQSAQTLLLASADDALNLAVMTQAKLLNPHIRIVNRLFNARLGTRLDYTLSNHISMSVAALVSPIFAFAALGNRAIGQLHLFGRYWPITEELIEAQHPWCGLSLKALWANPTRMLIDYEPVTGAIDLMTAITTDHRLQVGDRLILSNRPNAAQKRQSWRQQGRLLLVRVFSLRGQGRAMLLVLLALLLTIGVATLTYLSASRGVAFVDALYFSVGMITGAGGQETVAENSPAVVKVFTALMMLIGAGVIGICYALLNDLILGTHLQQLWNTVHTPHSGHHLICGLGGVGTRIAEQLRELGGELMAIERDPHSRFIGVARSQRISVLLGDASVPETLRTANIKRAASLLAVTSDDTVNLEIAITAKSLEPRLPVFVRIHDPKFAAQIQQVFDFDMVLSPTGLAATAFAAAAIGGRIFGDCMTQSGLWIAIATLITPHHPFYGRRLHAAAATEKFTPFYAEREGTRIQGQALLDLILEDGIVLYLMMPANRWEQLWVRQPLISNPTVPAL
jgi:voltage-gated potassium channel Kch